MMSNLTKITVVIPSYNQGRYIEATLQSLLNQHYPALEIIVMDACSTDNSVEIIKKYEGDIAYWVSAKDNGQSDAINRGFRRGSGRFKTWLNSDDLMLPGTLWTLHRSVMKNPACRWFAGNLIWIDAEDTIISVGKSEQWSTYFARRGLLSNGGPTMFFREDLLEERGYLREDFHYMMDTELYHRYIDGGECFLRLQQYCWALRIHREAKMSGHDFKDSEYAQANHPTMIKKKCERKHFRRLMTHRPGRWMFFLFKLNKVWDRSFYSRFHDCRLLNCKVYDIFDYGLPEIGFQTTYPAPYMDQLLESLEKDFRPMVVYLGERSGGRTWGSDYVPYLGSYCSAMSLAAYLGKLRKPSFVIAGGINYPRFLLGILWRLLLGKKTAIFSDYPENARPKKLNYWFKKWLFSRRQIVIFAAGAATVEYYRSCYGLPAEKVEGFPYEFNRKIAPEIAQGGFGEAQRKRLSVGGRIRLLVVNSFYERKGFRVLFDALCQLKMSGELARFEVTICGKGPDFESYKVRFGELLPEVTLLGGVVYERYVELMNQTDVFVHASLFEPFGIPPLDALLRQKVLVVSDKVMSVRGLIENGKNGFTYAADDPNALHEALCNVIANVDQFDAIGKTAADTVQEYYPIDIHALSINSTQE